MEKLRSHAMRMHCFRYTVAVRRRLCAWGGNIALLVGSLLVGVLILEIGVRVFVPENGIIERDGRIGKIHKRNLDRIVETHCYTAHIRTNSDGWIGADFPEEKQPGIQRFAHIGDSFVEGAQVDSDRTFVAQLPPLMGGEHLNFGMGGQGTFPEILTIRYKAEAENPDAVVLWFYTGNDFRDNLIAMVPMEEDSTLRGRAVRAVKYILLNTMRSPRFLYDRIGRNPLIQRTLIASGLLSMNTLREREAGSDIPLEYRTSVLDTPERAEAVDITRQALTRLRQETREDLILGILPSMLEMKPGAVDDAIHAYPALAGTTLELNFPRTAIKTIADDLGIPVFDAAPALQAAYANGEAPYLECDGHFSQEGHDALARAFAAWYADYR